MVYVMTWQAWHIIWPDGHGGYVLRHSGHGIRYGLVDIVWYMVWPGRHRMVYGMAWHCAWHMVWPSGHGMLYGMAVRAWYGIWFGMHNQSESRMSPSV